MSGLTGFISFVACFGSLITLGALGLSRSSRLGQRARLLAAGAGALFVAAAIMLLTGADSYFQSISFWDRHSGSNLQTIWIATLAVDAAAAIVLLVLSSRRSWVVRSLILLAATSSGVFFATLLLIAMAGN